MINRIINIIIVIDLNLFTLLFFHEKKAKTPLKNRNKKFPLYPVERTKVSEVSDTIKLNKENLLNFMVIRAMKVQ